MHRIEFYLRFFGAWTWFFIACCIGILLAPFQWKNPSLGAVFARIVIWAAHPIMGYRVRVENRTRLYINQPCIYVLNHQSNLDIITMSAFFPYRTVIIGKKELRWIPLFGFFFVGSGNILIDRASRKSSFSGLDVATRAIKERGVSVMLFPEGTRNRGALEMKPFKKGAFYMAIGAGVPVVPIVHQHLLSYFDWKKKKIYKGDVVMKVLEPIPTAGMTLEDMPKLMAEVRKRMEEALRSPEMGLAEARVAITQRQKT
ncbi:MAG: lysophospholipid acyltransferase family protein [Bdellovibrionota bacterium]